MDAEFVSPDQSCVAPDYSPSGVDLSLIRWMLTLTPAERLELLDARINEVERIRERNAAT
jgi:hypothetical protein